MGSHPALEALVERAFLPKCSLASLPLRSPSSSSSSSPAPAAVIGGADINPHQIHTHTPTPTNGGCLQSIPPSGVLSLETVPTSKPASAQRHTGHLSSGLAPRSPQIHLSRALPIAVLASLQQRPLQAWASPAPGLVSSARSTGRKIVTQSIVHPKEGAHPTGDTHPKRGSSCHCCPGLIGPHISLPPGPAQPSPWPSSELAARPWVGKSMTPTLFSSSRTAMEQAQGAGPRLQICRDS